MDAKKHKKLKWIFGVCYFFILALYIIFLIGSFIPKPHGEDIWLFGSNIYIVDQNQAVSVDFSRQPAEGDTIVCNIDGKKRLATVESVSSSNVLLLSTTVDGVTNYYTTNVAYGVVVKNIPAVGSIYAFLSSIWGILCIIILPCTIFLIFQVIVLIRLSRCKNQKFTGVDFLSEKSADVSDDFQKYYQRSTHSRQPLKPISHSEIRTKFDDVLPLSDGITRQKPKESEKSLIEPSIDDTLSDLKFKMAFQDTHEISKRVDETIEEDNEQLNELKEYGIETSTIEDGVEIKMDPQRTSNILLRLKNDGSLAIITDNYTANIDLEIE